MWRRLHHRPTVDVPGVRFYSGATGRPYRPTAERAADAITAQGMGTIDFVGHGRTGMGRRCPGVRRARAARRCAPAGSSGSWATGSMWPSRSTPRGTRAAPAVPGRGGTRRRGRTRPYGGALRAPATAAPAPADDGPTLTVPAHWAITSAVPGRTPVIMPRAPRLSPVPAHRPTEPAESAAAVPDPRPFPYLRRRQRRRPFPHPARPRPRRAPVPAVRNRGRHRHGTAAPARVRSSRSTPAASSRCTRTSSRNTDRAPAVPATGPSRHRARTRGGGKRGPVTSPSPPCLPGRRPAPVTAPRAPRPGRSGPSPPAGRRFDRAQLEQLASRPDLRPVRARVRRAGRVRRADPDARSRRCCSPTGSPASTPCRGLAESARARHGHHLDRDRRPRRQLVPDSTGPHAGRPDDRGRARRTCC